MKFFIDSVDVEAIKQYVDYGVIDGVTTNPSLMASTKFDLYQTIDAICRIVSGDVSVEVTSNDYEAMVQEGEKISSIADNIVIKLPVTWDGIKACKYFSSKGQKTNLTLCFSVTQALLAASAGATYISPFIGRLEDVGADGIELISNIRMIYDNYGFDTKILAASIRSLDHVNKAALCGADFVTIPPKIMSSLLDHQLTESGLLKFNQDWAKSGMKF
jgi:transaldolase